MRRYCEICCDIVTEAPGPHSCSMASRMSYARDHFYTEHQRNSLIAADNPEKVAEQIRRIQHGKH